MSTMSHIKIIRTKREENHRCFLTEAKPVDDRHRDRLRLHLLAVLIGCERCHARPQMLLERKNADVPVQSYIAVGVRRRWTAGIHIGCLIVSNLQAHRDSRLTHADGHGNGGIAVDLLRNRDDLRIERSLRRLRRGRGNRREGRQDHRRRAFGRLAVALIALATGWRRKGWWWIASSLGRGCRARCIGRSSSRGLREHAHKEYCKDDTGNKHGSRGNDQYFIGWIAPPELAEHLERISEPGRWLEPHLVGMHIDALRIRAWVRCILWQAGQHKLRRLGCLPLSHLGIVIDHKNLLSET